MVVKSTFFFLSIKGAEFLRDQIDKSSAARVACPSPYPVWNDGFKTVFIVAINPVPYWLNHVIADWDDVVHEILEKHLHDRHAKHTQSFSLTHSHK